MTPGPFSCVGISNVKSEVGNDRSSETPEENSHLFNEELLLSVVMLANCFQRHDENNPKKTNPDELPPNSPNQ